MAHMPNAELDPADAISAAVSAGVPVSTVRQWTTALAPRVGGGWDFVCQAYHYPNDQPSEWIVVNLDERTYARTEGANQVYCNSNFQIASANTGITTTNQLRAPNGRIFFAQRYGHIGTDVTDQCYVNVAYFDPSDRAVHQMSSIDAPSTSRHAAIYSAVFDASGNNLYMGSQAAIGHQPFVFSIDPVTLAVTVIGQVGVAASVNPKYAYYLARDVGNNWLYVAVGQDPWELVKIDVTTGAQTVLATTTTGVQNVAFDAMANGWRTTIKDNGVNSFYWVADGAITPWPGSGAPPGGARTVTPYTNALTAPPEIDWSRGIGQVLWRAHGSTGSFTSVSYSVLYTGPISIESLTALPDASVFGNAEQYSGFFRRPSTDAIDWFGEWPGGLSQPVLLPVSSALVYLAGYPNGALYSYDPRAEWNPGGSSANPLSLGNYFTASGVKYSYHLERCATNGRIYQAGRRERDSSGSGIGYYDPSGATFAGVTTAPLDNLIPRGMVVMDTLARVVFSGKTLDASDAKLLVYSLDLAPLSQHTIQAGIKNTGALFETSDPAVIVGLTNDSPFYLFRFNVQTGELLTIMTLGATVGPSTQRADGTIWVMLGSNLVRIDPETLDRTTIASMAGVGTITRLAWSGDTLWLAADTELFSARARTIPTTGHADTTAPTSIPASGHADPTP